MCVKSRCHFCEYFRNQICYYQIIIIICMICYELKADVGVCAFTGSVFSVLAP